MSEVSNPTPAEYKGVSVEHPRVKEYAKNAGKMGMSLEQAVKIVGQPAEVVEKYWKEGQRERK